MRINLRADLITARHLAGLSQKAAGARMGVAQPVFARFELGNQWTMSTVHRWARAVDRRAVFTIVGFGEPWRVHGHPGHETVCPAGPPDDVDRWHRAKLIADAIGARFAARVSLARVADIIGCTYQTVSNWEDYAEYDSRLAVVQRYVRGAAILGRLPDAHLAAELHDPGMPAQTAPTLSDPANTIPA